MNSEGPLLEHLMRRLAETPADFSGNARVNVAAVLSDVLVALGGTSLLRRDANLLKGDAGKPEQRVRLLAGWLLHDAWFVEKKSFAPAALEFFLEGIQSVSEVAPEKFVNDPDRREEFVRVSLNALGLRPRGETIAQAQDRLTTLNSAERARVIQAARAAQERAREIREAMLKRAAEEAAAKMNRE